MLPDDEWIQNIRKIIQVYHFTVVMESGNFCIDSSGS